MDKIDRLLDAIEHPERYNSAEFEEMLRDPEVKKTFDLLDKTKSSLQVVSIPDVEEEWKKFELTHRNFRSTSPFRLKDQFPRKVAATVAIWIISLSAVAAFVGIGLRHIHHPNPFSASKPVEIETEMKASLPDSIKKAETEKKATAEIVVFDNETLENIISKIANYYDCKAEFSKEESKSLRLYFRWDQSMTMEKVAERLNNFEQIQIKLKEKTILIN